MIKKAAVILDYFNEPVEVMFGFTGEEVEARREELDQNNIFSRPIYFKNSPLNIENIHTLIKFWRDQRDNSITSEHRGKASCYVDAFQTVLVNHFLEPLPEEIPEGNPQHEARETNPSEPRTHIKLTKTEMQSGCDRQCWAEDLILQLPRDHEGRNSWLLNYGRGATAESDRCVKDIKFNEETQAAETK